MKLLEEDFILQKPVGAFANPPERASLALLKLDQVNLNSVSQGKFISLFLDVRHLDVLVLPYISGADHWWDLVCLPKELFTFLFFIYFNQVGYIA